MKKGQISPFILIAIAVVGIIIIFFIQYNSGNKIFPNEDLNSKTDIVKTFTTSCIEDSLTNSIKEVSLKGGYYQKPDNKKPILETTKYGYDFSPYYFHIDEINRPSKEEINSELTKALNEKLDNCLNVIAVEGLEINYNKNKAKTKIEKNEVSLDIDLTININSLNEEDSYSETVTINKAESVESKFYDILEVAKFLTDSHSEDPDNLCISCVEEILENSNLFAEIYKLDESTNEIIIYEETTNLNQEFIYLDKYETN